jgi:predicted NAD/FAD-binding protein
MSRIAIIGTGISGLSAAYMLSQRHQVTVYEKQSRIGGHSRTMNIQYGDRTMPVDTGFIVFNEQNYPNLTAMFRHLGARAKKSDMSFALTVGDGWLEWGAKDLRAILAQPRNLLRPRFLKLFIDVMRFNRDALAEASRAPEMTVDGLIRHMRLGDWFRRHYLLPMAGAIWSCPPRQMLEFPACALLQFFANHNLLSMEGQPQWLTLEGGAQTYVDRLASILGTRIRTACGALEITRHGSGVKIVDEQGNAAHFDKIVLACHSDEALALLRDASGAEHAALGAIRYQPNQVVLHKDPSFMPKRKHAWASWVYHSDGAGEEPAISVTYWMNSLQGIDRRYPLFVALNPSRPIAPEDTFDRHEFSHPVLDFAAVRAQAMVKSMQGERNTWFCGAWLGHGFHEDGLVSAMAVAERLGSTAPWLGQSPAAETRPRARHRIPALALGDEALAFGD